MAKIQPAGFDYANASRGYWARLRDGGGREVILTEGVTTLIAMHRAGVLAGTAKADAEAISPGDQADQAATCNSVGLARAQDKI